MRSTALVSTRITVEHESSYPGAQYEREPGTRQADVARILFNNERFLVAHTLARFRITDRATTALHGRVHAATADTGVIRARIPVVTHGVHRGEVTTIDVGQRITQAQMRHQDPRLTAGAYADESLLTVAAEICKLPDLPTAAVKKSPAVANGLHMSSIG